MRFAGHPRVVLWVAVCMLAAACDLRSPHALVEIHDDGGLASSATALLVRHDDGQIRIQLRDESLPTRVTLWVDGGARTIPLWVDAVDESGTPLARGSAVVTFPATGAGSATVGLLAICNSTNLGSPCSFDAPAAGDGICHSTGCEPSSCGDGFLDEAAGEICDDGNGNPNDTCVVSACGEPELCRPRTWDTLVIGGVGQASGDPMEHRFGRLLGLALSPDGRFAYAADAAARRVYRIDLEDSQLYLPQNPRISVIAGGGLAGRAVEGKPAGLAQLARPVAVVTDRLGNLYIADADDHCVHRIGPEGLMHTVAGVCGSPGTGTTFISTPIALAPDGLGNLYLLEAGTKEVRRVDSVSGVVVTVAGGGALAPSEGSMATEVDFEGPIAIAVDGTTNDLYIIDRAVTPEVLGVSYQVRVWRLPLGSDSQPLIAAATGSIVTGTYAPPACLGGTRCDTTLATEFPAAAVVTDEGELLFSDPLGNRLWRLSGGVAEAFAGTGAAASGPDGLPWTDTDLHAPVGLAASGAGESLQILVAEAKSQAVRRFDASSEAVVAGRPSEPEGEGLNVLSFSVTANHTASPYFPGSLHVASLPDGTPYLLFSSFDEGYLRRAPVSLAGLISTVAGTGDPCPESGICNDGGPASDALLDAVAGFDRAADETIYLLERSGGRVRRLEPDGAGAYTIDTVLEAGHGLFGEPRDLAVSSSGWLWVLASYEIGRLSSDGSIWERIAGDGVSACAAPECAVSGPASTALVGVGGTVIVGPKASSDAPDEIYFADPTARRVRKLHHDGVAWQLDVVAGDGTPCTDTPDTCGIGGDPTLANISRPLGLTFDPSGRLYVSDAEYGVIWQIDGTVWKHFAGSPDVTTSATYSGAPLTTGLGSPGRLQYWEYAPASGGLLRQLHVFAQSERGSDTTSAGLISHIVITDTGTAAAVYPTVGAVVATGNGELSRSAFASPAGIAVFESIPSLLIADPPTGQVRLLSFATVTVSTAIGLPGGDATEGFNGIFSRLLEEPFGITCGSNCRFGPDAGYGMFVSERRGHTIRRVDLTTAGISTLAGKFGEPGSADGLVAEARFHSPMGLAYDHASDVLYVADNENHTIRAIDLSSGLDAASVRTIAGQVRQIGRQLGASGSESFLNAPEAVTVDSTGTLYIADTGNDRVLRMTPSNLASGVSGTDRIETLIGADAQTALGDTVQAAVPSPRGLVTDRWGNLYVAAGARIYQAPRSVAIPADPQSCSPTAPGPFTGELRTFYGGPDGPAWQSTTRCLAGLATSVDPTSGDLIFFVDQCTGYVVGMNARAP